MKTQHIAKLLAFATLIIMILSYLSHHQAMAQGGLNLRLPFSGTHRLTAYVDHRSPTYGNDTYSNIVVYNGEDRIPCADCGQAWTTQGPYCYNGHDGTDYSLDCGTSVLAAADGTVAFIGTEYGNTIKIDHENGYRTWYAHLTSNSYTVNVGDKVVAGQQIATSGSSGTTACHLHFGVYRNGNVTDPFGWRGDYEDPLAENAICLWGDGQCSEIVIEDESDWFYKYGTGWDWDCHGNGWTLRRVPNRSASENAYAHWRPDLPYAGPYAVFVFIPADHATTTNATYIIHDKNGDHTVSINQHDHPNEWVSLGTYDFWEGITGYIHMGDATGEADGSTEVCFDSIKFRQFHIYLPIILKNYPPAASFATIVLDAPQPDGDNGWYVSDVQVSFTVPSTMPLPSIEYRLNMSNWLPFTMPFTITTEGENLVQIRPAEGIAGPFGVRAYWLRMAGVTEEILSFIVKIDKSLPALMITAPQPITYTHGITFALDYQATDAYSGLAGITATLDTQPVTNGQAIDTLALGYGMHEFALAAQDMAGHIANRSVAFTVTATISGLMDLKHRLYAEGGIYGPGAGGVVQSLDAKLDAAQRNVEAGQYQAAINNLRAFINEVEAQTDKHITPDAARLLIEDAQRIIASLSDGLPTARATSGTMFTLSGDE
jgi:hypothetical protein